MLRASFHPISSFILVSPSTKNQAFRYLENIEYNYLGFLLQSKSGFMVGAGSLVPSGDLEMISKKSEI